MGEGRSHYDMIMLFNFSLLLSSSFDSSYQETILKVESFPKGKNGFFLLGFLFFLRSKKLGENYKGG